MQNAFDDEYLIDEPSDDDDFSDTSSEDDVQTFLKNICGEGKAKDSDDDFEKEMNKEIDNHVKKMEKLQQDANENVDGMSGFSKSNATRKTSQQGVDHSNSDDESEVKKRKQAEPSNDELLYDPDMDDQDQKWIDDKRRHYLCHPEQKGNEKPKPLPTSDAVLNCPACMSLLSMDCQRHEIYKTQYRAMFVMNCTVDFSQELVYPVKKKTKKRHHSENFTASLSASGEEIYHAVHCTVCNSEVGVYDNNEVYHFFNVLASFP